MFTNKKLTQIILLTLACISFTLSAKCKDGSNCPGSQTCCMAAHGVGCCPYADAICCGDGQHCCPNGYVCGDNACYAPSQGTPALSLLINSNRKSFLETSSFISASDSANNNNNKSNDENSNYGKNNKDESEMISSSSVSRTELDLNSNSGSQKSLEILEDEATKSISISASSNQQSFLNRSRFEEILEKLDNLNNSYMKKFFGCFKDMEPVVQDLLTAYRQKNEKTETLINIMKSLVNKLAVDGTKMTSDCKAVFVLAGIAGIV